MKPIEASSILNPPELETERLFLKPARLEFAEHIYTYLGDFELRTTMKMPVQNTPEKQAKWWETFERWKSNGEAAQWCAFAKEDGSYIGLFTLKEINQANYRGELGYSINKTKWNKGFGKEGCERVVEYAFKTIGLHRLFAQILPYNIPSQKLASSLGFKKEALMREEHFYEGEFYDVLQYGLINPHHQ
jgi:ribosomal-protein-alanine N-acetyltransferase